MSEGAVVDPVTLIVAALAAGAGAGLKDAAGSAVRDAYQGLRALVRRRFEGKPAAEVALAEHEQDPKTYEQPLRKYVAETGVDQDPAAVELAQKVMALLDGPGSQAGTYVVDARYAQRFQIGQRNIQFG